MHASGLARQQRGVALQRPGRQARVVSVRAGLFSKKPAPAPKKPEKKGGLGGLFGGKPKAAPEPPKKKAGFSFGSKPKGSRRRRGTHQIRVIRH